MILSHEWQIRNAAVQQFEEFAESLLRGELFVNLIIYADESGTNNPTGEEPTSEVPVIAGYMGWRDEWRKFCPAWKAILDRYKISCFHAKDFFNNRSSEYLYWKHDKCESFKYALAEIAGRYIPIGGSYHIKHHYKKNPLDETYPYKYAMRFFFKDLFDSMNEWDLLGQKVSIVFHRTTNKKWIAAIAEEIDNVKKRGINICGHAYGDDKEYLPLQAADYLAYRSRQRHFEKLEGQIELQNKTGKNKHVYLRPTVLDIVLGRNLHPQIGFRPKMNDEIKTEVSEMTKKHKSVKRALLEIPNNYFGLK